MLNISGPLWFFYTFWCHFCIRYQYNLFILTVLHEMFFLWRVQCTLILTLSTTTICLSRNVLAFPLICIGLKCALVLFVRTIILQEKLQLHGLVKCFSSFNIRLRITFDSTDIDKHLGPMIIVFQKRKKSTKCETSYITWRKAHQISGEITAISGKYTLVSHDLENKPSVIGYKIFN